MPETETQNATGEFTAQQVEIIQLLAGAMFTDDIALFEAIMREANDPGIEASMENSRLFLNRWHDNKDGAKQES